MYVRAIIAAAAIAAFTPVMPATAQPQGQPPAATQPQQSSQPQAPAQPQQPVAQPAQPAQPQPKATPPVTLGPVGTTGQLPAPTPMTPQATSAGCGQIDVSTAMALLDRMQRLLDGAVKDDLGKVTIDRGVIDEMRAEVAQIRASIGPVKP